MAKPFLKWVGGKRQLISKIEQHIEPFIQNCDTYIEPFVGGGALLFHLLNKYEFKTVRIYDINPELILCYTSIRDNVKCVNEKLLDIIEKYPTGEDILDRQKDEYYSIRKIWNSEVGKILEMNDEQKAMRVAQTIFLNKTCFNGLFRVNKGGGFNVPIGRYKYPSFPKAEELEDVSKALKNVEIGLGSYESCEPHVNERTFVYFDPPYRPLNSTSSFTSYSKDAWTDNEQEKLADFFTDLHSKGAHLLLSNSDPTNGGMEDPFFDSLYSEFKIKRVNATRMVNSNAKKRTGIRELMIYNEPQKK